MKYIGNWKTWENKDGSVKRIYVAADKYLEEGETGLCSQSGNFTADEVAYAYKLIGKKTFAELFEQIKSQNGKDNLNKISISIE